MTITKETIQKVAAAARLSLTKEEQEQFLPQLSECLEAFSTLSKVDTTGVEPSFHPVPLSGALREDTPGECLSQDQALSQTTNKKEGYFTGPKAV